MYHSSQDREKNEATPAPRLWNDVCAFQALMQSKESPVKFTRAKKTLQVNYGFRDAVGSKNVSQMEYYGVESY